MKLKNNFKHYLASPLTNDMSLGFGEADSDVKRVYNWLAEVLVHGSIPQSAQVNAVKKILVPKVPRRFTEVRYKSQNSPSPSID